MASSTERRGRPRRLLSRTRDGDIPLLLLLLLLPGFSLPPDADLDFLKSPLGRLGGITDGATPASAAVGIDVCVFHGPSPLPYGYVAGVSRMGCLARLAHDVP